MRRHLSTSRQDSASTSVPWGRVRLFRIWFAAVFGIVLLSGCELDFSSFIDPQGPIAAQQKAHLIRVTWLTMIAVLPVLVLVPLMLWRYRYRNTKARYRPDWEYSGWLDAIMWGVPFAIIIALSAMLWHNTKALDPYKPLVSDVPPLNVQVVALDWKWLFIYPDLGIASMDRLAFPAERPVALKLTTDTVMQSFMVGALAGQIYAMPGMQTQLQILADAPGTFRGENTQFNGQGFAHQKFDAVAMTKADFEAWVENVRAGGIALDDKTYSVLGKPTTGAETSAALGTSAMPDGVVYFNAVDPGFYHQVLSRYHMGTAIAPEAQPGSPSFTALEPVEPSSHSATGTHHSGTKP